MCLAKVACRNFAVAFVLGISTLSPAQAAPVVNGSFETLGGTTSNPYTVPLGASPGSLNTVDLLLCNLEYHLPERVRSLEQRDISVRPLGNLSLNRSGDSV
jgi:hypothetical protein